MADKICPLMSRPIATKNDGDVARVGVEWVDCQKGNCQFWTQVYTTENSPLFGCALVMAAHKTQDGKYAV